MTTTLRAAVKEAFQILHHRYEHKNAITGLTTGFTVLDDLMGGLQPGELIVLGARPSQGKTTLAMNIVEHVAIKLKGSAAVFSMDMSASQLAFRLISSLGRIDQQHLRSGDIQDEEWPCVTSAISLLSDAKVFIDDTSALSLAELCMRARWLTHEHDLSLIVIDYLQLMRVPGSESRATEIEEISHGLKALAKELNVPVIALSQLNHRLEYRTDKRPIMSDLRESGAIDQDADVILFIYRDEYYNPESTDKGTAEIIIGKRRNGPTGRVKLTALLQYAKFENWTPDKTG
jgi:replicative DNA helicase